MSQRKAHLLAPEEGRWIGWLGHTIRYLATAKQTAGRYCLSTAGIGKGDGAPPHSHEFEEGFYILSGKVRFKAGNQTVVLGAGDFINVCGGTVHAPEGLEESHLLVIAAPSGFDLFQIKAGEGVAFAGCRAAENEAGSSFLNSRDCI